MLCPICCDEFETPSRIAKCNFCNYETCKACAQQYLLTSIEPTAHCMNCRKGWTREMLLDLFPKKFVSDEYKKHRENILFEREKSLLPATQPYAEREMQVRRMKQEIDNVRLRLVNAEKEFFERHPGAKEFLDTRATLVKAVTPIVPSHCRLYCLDPISFLNDNLRQRVCEYPCNGVLQNERCMKCMANVCDGCGLRYYQRATAPPHMCKQEAKAKESKRRELIEDFRKLHAAPCAREYFEHAGALDNMRYRFEREIAQKTREVRRDTQLWAANGGVAGLAGDEAGPSKERKTFVRACPAEGCRGFLSSAWKCGMCNIFVCPQCHEIKGEKRDVPHECKPENVETAKLLAKDTKGCPNCGVRIFKISGCDQMYCVECNTAFSWNTGQIAKGNIHNPHYYEYLRSLQGGAQGREIRDIPCGGLPDYMVLVNHFKRYLTKEQYARLEPYHRVVGEVIDLRQWYRNHNAEDTRNVRVKYLLKDYDDVAFKRMLQMKAKAHEKIQNIDQVLDMFVMASSAILQRVHTLHTVEELCSIFIELEELRKYMNESMKRVELIYDCKTPWIGDNLALHRVGERKE